MKLNFKIFSIFIIILFLFCIPIKANANADTEIKIIDNANIITEQMEQEIEEYIKKNNQNSVETVIIYSSTEKVPDPNEDAKKVYKNNTKNRNGFVLYINTTTRKYAFWASGKPFRNITNQEIDLILDAGGRYLGSSDYDNTYKAMLRNVFRVNETTDERNVEFLKLALIYSFFATFLSALTNFLYVEAFKNLHKEKPVQLKEYPIQIKEIINKDEFVKKIEHRDVGFYRSSSDGGSDSGSSGTSFSGGGFSGGGSRDF